MQLGNWIRETSTTIGAGNLTVAAVTGWSKFSDQFGVGADGVGDHFYYAIIDDTTLAPYEAGIGRMLDAFTLVRVRVLASYVAGVYAEANTPVTLAAGTYRIICADLASARQMALPGVRLGAALRAIGSRDLNTATGNARTITAGTLYGVPFCLASSALITGAILSVITAAATSTARIGIYRLTANLEPGGLIAQTLDMDTTTTGIKSYAWGTGTRRFPAGYYYLAVLSNGGSPGVLAGGPSTLDFPGHALQGGIDGANFNYSFGTAAATGPAMPATCPVLSWVGSTIDYAPMLFLAPAAP